MLFLNVTHMGLILSNVRTTTIAQMAHSELIARRKIYGNDPSADMAFTITSSFLSS